MNNPDGPPDDTNTPWPTDNDNPHPIIAALHLIENSTPTGPDTETETRELAWDPIDLAPILNGTITTETPTILTRTDGHPLIYPGRHHDIHGEPGQGKSWVCLAACIDVVNQGHAAIWVDWEDTPEAFVTRLRALGVEDAIIGDPTALRFVRPNGPFGVLDVDALLALATSIDAHLVVFDALADALSYQNMEENSNTDAHAWLSRVARPFNNLGIATLIADHVTKDPATRTRGPVGAGGKLRFIDGVSYNLKTVVPFDRQTPGSSTLIIDKDRHGHVGTQGKSIAKVTFVPSDNGETLALALVPPEDSTDDEGRFIPSHLMERISRHLETLPAGAQLSKRSIIKDVSGNDKALRTAIDRLVEYGNLVADVTGTNPVYSLNTPYREPDKTDIDLADSDDRGHRGQPRPSRGQEAPEEGAATRPLSRRERPHPGGRAEAPKNSEARPTEEDTPEATMEDDEPW